MRDFRWSEWIRQTLTRKAPARRRTARSLPVEQLESRTLLTNNVLVFAAVDAEHGEELWRTDGTAEGTVLIKDIFAGEDSSDIGYTGEYGDPPFFFNLNGVIVFTADDGVHGTELWRTDGTTEGTFLLKDTTQPLDEEYPLYSYGLPHSPTVVGDQVFFVVNDLAHGRELWVTDGTSDGTFLVKDINTTDRQEAGYNYGSYPDHLFAHNGLLFFTAVRGDGLDGQITELWRSDGTEAGTFAVLNLFNDDFFSYHYAGDPALEQFASVGTTLFFSADDGTTGMELWKTDGTIAGTSLVKDIAPGNYEDYPYTSYPYSGYPFGLIAVGNQLFFGTIDPDNGTRLWKSDGTEAGTVPVQTLDDDADYDAAYYAEGIAFDGKLFFTADDGDHGFELWVSDGTAEGTFLLKDINDEPYESSYPTAFTIFNGELYFVASDIEHGKELWKTDGTTNGTVLVKDINPGPDDAYPGGYGYGDYTTPAFVIFNGLMYFPATDGEHGLELWGTDGTEAGTQLVKDINEGPVDGSYPGGYGYYGSLTFVALGSFLYFPATDMEFGMELWRTDGTEAGTTRVKDIFEGPTESYPGGYYGGVMLGLFVDLGSNFPPSVSDALFTLQENAAAGVQVGQVNAEDIDEGDVLTYSITGGNEDGNFTINPETGMISVATGAVLNFEGTNEYTLTVLVEDSAGGSGTGTINIQLFNVNEPATVDNAMFEIDENSPLDTFVGIVTGADPDAGDMLTYRISNGNPGLAFKIDPTTGELSVNNPAALDFETTPSYNLLILARDSGNLDSFVGTITITVHDLNDIPKFTSTPATTTYSKKAVKQNGAPKIVPNIIVDDADTSEAFRPGGGTLTISLDVKGKATKKGFASYDSIGGLAGANALGTVTGPTVLNDRVHYSIVLNAETTAAQVQAFLRGLTFSTSGKGAKILTRTFRVRMTDASGELSNVHDQTISITK